MTTQNKPNVVFILADDMGEWALKCAGNEDIFTPNLDRLAKSGMRFNNFFCVSPVCSPARASILTGKIPSQHGVHDWLRGGNLLGSIENAAFSKIEDIKSNDVPIQYLDNHRAYTQDLCDIGYECALSGKWHLGDSLVPQKGFDHWYTIGRGGCHYMQPDMVKDGKLKIVKEYVTYLITDDAINYIQSKKDSSEPFYLSVHYTAPHSSWDHDQHPKEFIDLYNDCEFKNTPDLPMHPNQIETAPQGTGERRKYLLNGYYAAISAMDKCVGDIIDKLEETNALDNTLIIFTGDNGMNMGHHGLWGKGNASFPLNMYDTSVKVPMIVSWPNHIKNESVCEKMLSHYDIYPTILDIAGINNVDETRPGKSFVDALNGDFEADCNDNVIIFDEYGSTRMIRSNEYKYVHRFPYGPHEFYDLKSDPNEDINLFDNDEYDEQIVGLRRKLIEWFEKYTMSEMDGSKLGVTGRGQLERVGKYSNMKRPFAESTLI